MNLPLATAPPTGVYTHGRGVYVNLTNRCPTACVFCAKGPSGWTFESRDLRLAGKEPSAADVLEAAEPLLETGRYAELVFCGFGESTYRLPALLAIARETRRRFSAVRRRLNTIGLGNLIWGRDIVPDLALGVQAVSVSLNTADPAQWRRLHAPRPEFAEDGFDAALRFAASCVRAGLETTITAVEQPGVDSAAVEAVARRLGASFRFRPLLADAAPSGG